MPPAHPLPLPVGDPAALEADDSAQLELSTTPAGATAFVDGKEACVTPCTVRVPFGLRRIRIEHEGQVVERELNVLQDVSLQIVMER